MRSNPFPKNKQLAGSNWSWQIVVCNTSNLVRMLHIAPGVENASLHVKHIWRSNTELNSGESVENWCSENVESPPPFSFLLVSCYFLFCACFLASATWWPLIIFPLILCQFSCYYYYYRQSSYLLAVVAYFFWHIFSLQYFLGITPVVRVLVPHAMLIIHSKGSESLKSKRKPFGVQSIEKCILKIEDWCRVPDVLRIET